MRPSIRVLCYALSLIFVSNCKKITAEDSPLVLPTATQAEPAPGENPAAGDEKLSLTAALTTSAASTADNLSFQIDDDGQFTASGRCETGSQVTLKTQLQATDVTPAASSDLSIDCTDGQFSSDITIDKKALLSVSQTQTDGALHEAAIKVRPYCFLWMNDKVMDSKPLFGLGTAAKPYRICDENQLREMETSGVMRSSETYIELAQDLAMAQIWVPLGASDRSSNGHFRAHLDGKNFMIYMIILQDLANPWSNVGLISVLDGGSVKNIHFYGAIINFTDAQTGSDAIEGIGIVAGTMIDSSIDNIQFFQSYINYAATASPVNFVGGVVGKATNSTLTNISGSLVVDVLSGINVGGIVGSLIDTDPNDSIQSLISNVRLFDNWSVVGYNTVGGIAGSLYGANINNSSSDSNIGVANTLNGASGGNGIVGGIVGYAQDARVARSAFINTISSDVFTSKSVGGLIGHSLRSTLSDSYFTNTQSLSADNAVGGLIGTAMNSSISRAYSSTSVNGSTDYGMSVGLSDSTTYSQVYFNSDPSVYIGDEELGRKVDGDQLTNSPNIFGGDNSQMQSSSHFVGWDFTNVWQSSPGNFPTLRAP